MIACEAFDLRAAGVGETKHFCHLVKGFTDGVVASLAENLKIILGFHQEEDGVAAGD